MSRSSCCRGQAQVEYILLIGLVSLFIVVALIGFREAVIEYICKVIVAIGGDPIAGCGSPTAPAPEVAAAPPAAAPPAPNPPPPTPTPSPTPLTGELSGEWCVYWGGDFSYRTTFTLLPDGNYRSGANGTINLGSDRFLIQNAEGPFIRQPDGSWVDPLRYRPQGVAFRRCP